MFAIELLPAEYGDAILIEYGTRGRTRRILIDGGTPQSFEALRTRILSIPQSDREFELLVVTHIDSDHIGGVIPLLEWADEGSLDFREVWFNGYNHLVGAAEGDDILGGVQGEILSARLRKEYATKWNTSFDRKAVGLPSTGAPLSVSLEGGMELVVLGPSLERMRNLAPKWDAECQRAGLLPGAETQPPDEGDVLGDDEEEDDIDELARSAFSSDRALPNGSSITFLARYEGKSALFLADAFPKDVLDALRRISEVNLPLAVDAVKVSHHGSKANTSPKLLDVLRSPKWLFSSNGDQHSHPHATAIARVLKSGQAQPQLIFNYRSEQTERWDDRELQDAHNFTCKFGKGGTVRLEL